MTHWAQHIIYSATITSICAALGACLATDTLQHSPIPSLSTVETDLLVQFHEAEILVEQTKDKYCQAQRFEFAPMIIASSPVLYHRLDGPPRDTEMYLSFADCYGCIWDGIETDFGQVL